MLSGCANDNVGKVLCAIDQTLGWTALRPRPPCHLANQSCKPLRCSRYCLASRWCPRCRSCGRPPGFTKLPDGTYLVLLRMVSSVVLSLHLASTPRPGICREGWVGIMNMYRDGYSSTFSKIYFLVVVGFGAFFMINLFFAVMWEQFSAIADIESQKVRGVGGAGHPAGCAPVKAADLVVCEHRPSGFYARRVVRLLFFSCGSLGGTFFPGVFADRATRVGITLNAANLHVSRRCPP